MDIVVIIGAIIGFFTGLGGIITALWTARSAATKAELESLRQTIITLQGENKRLACDNKELRGRVGKLEDRNQEQDKENNNLSSRVRILETENYTLRGEVDRLKNENIRLEQENAQLMQRVSDLEAGK